MLALLIIFTLNNNIEVLLPDFISEGNDKLLCLIFLLQSITQAVISIAMLYLFLNLFKFFLSYRKANLLESNNELTRFNKFIICWVLFLCFLVLWNIITLIILGISTFLAGSFSKINESPLHTYYLSVMYRIVIPIKDLLIALSFAYLYYYQRMK
jgi:hypothetical protein